MFEQNCLKKFLINLALICLKFTILLVENLLEPGIAPANFIDKKAELDFIRNHPTIPEEYKEEFISFLEERADLFSGEEFSKKHFPRDVYEHDVESK